MNSIKVTFFNKDGSLKHAITYENPHGLPKNKEWRLQTTRTAIEEQLGRDKPYFAEWKSPDGQTEGFLGGVWLGEAGALERYAIEKKEEWSKWATEIPFIQWPADWKVRAVPPFLMAIVRYNVEKPDGSQVSIYLDCYDKLGHFGEPYWEVYPHEGDVFRCAMNDTEALLKAIGEAEGRKVAT